MMQTNLQRVQVQGTLDVQSIERELAQLWKGHAGAAHALDESATLRARVLNLMIYVRSEQALDAVDEVLAEIVSAYPCRALLMLAEKEAADRDIEMSVTAHCREAAGAARRQLCCEQVILNARGRYALELPSAATPLLVSDLPVFLWWRERLSLEDEIFKSLSRASSLIPTTSAARTKTCSRWTSY
jgi:glucose-6-phosphate dehydrogenase assembly protein OpcA